MDTWKDKIIISTWVTKGHNRKFVLIYVVILKNGSATLKFWIKIKALLIPKTISFIQGLNPHLQKLNPIENSPHPDHNDHSPPPPVPTLHNDYLF